jgi:enamine deaminase RidA (YjgF/YER057c/UK114 family)
VNGIEVSGRLVLTAGLVGWDETGRFPDGLLAQVRQTLKNIVTVLAEAHAKSDHIVRMTWYLTNKADYLAQSVEIGRVYREIMGRHFPAMAVLQVAALIEDRALVEIETTAVIP